MSSTRNFPKGMDLYADAALRQPVFIVGMNGSGTTMLLDCLGRHSQLYGFPRETRLIPHLMRVAPRYEPLHNDDNFRCLWNYAASLAPFRLANRGTPKPLPPGWESCTRDLAGLLNMLFLSYPRDEGTAGKTVWCEKSPQYGQHMLLLSELFPRARFVHVIRDGRDCACSFHRRWRRSPELTMVRWKLMVRTARAQGELLGERYIEVRYEDLTSAPEIWMHRVCRALEIPFEPSVLESSQPYMTEGDQDGGLKANAGRWTRYFNDARAERLERIGGRMLRECGYQTSWPDSDDMPPRWRRRLWSASDSVFQLLREIVLKLTGRIERPWWVILSRPLNAYRQARENRF